MSIQQTILVRTSGSGGEASLTPDHDDTRVPYFIKLPGYELWLTYVSENHLIRLARSPLSLFCPLRKHKHNLLTDFVVDQECAYHTRVA